MTAEGHRHTRLLLNLGGVSMPGGRVDAHDPGALRMVRRGTAIETSRGRSRLRVHDETVGSDEARLCKGADREDGRRRDAARPRDEGRLPDRVAVEFRQAVD